ncbi:MAG: hypothetical protein KDC24_07720, partial [Saprospiraceae bacterium]|nr:hypothetical protein [Saprospiraceae bacterium]
MSFQGYFKHTISPFFPLLLCWAFIGIAPISGQTDTIPTETDTPLLDLLEDDTSLVTVDTTPSVILPDKRRNPSLFTIHTTPLDTNEIQYYYA